MRIRANPCYPCYPCYSWGLVGSVGKICCSLRRSASPAAPPPRRRRRPPSTRPPASFVSIHQIRCAAPPISRPCTADVTRILPKKGMLFGLLVALCLLVALDPGAAREGKPSPPRRSRRRQLSAAGEACILDSNCYSNVCSCGVSSARRLFGAPAASRQSSTCVCAEAAPPPPPSPLPTPPPPPSPPSPPPSDWCVPGGGCCQVYCSNPGGSCGANNPTVCHGDACDRNRNPDGSAMGFTSPGCYGCTCSSNG